MYTHSVCVCTHRHVTHVDATGARTHTHIHTQTHTHARTYTHSVCVCTHRHVTHVDATAARTFGSLNSSLGARGVRLLFAGLSPKATSVSVPFGNCCWYLQTAKVRVNGNLLAGFCQVAWQPLQLERQPFDPAVANCVSSVCVCSVCEQCV